MWIEKSAEVSFTPRLLISHIITIRYVIINRTLKYLKQTKKIVLKQTISIQTQKDTDLAKLRTRTKKKKIQNRL